MEANRLLLAVVITITCGLGCCKSHVLKKHSTSLDLAAEKRVTVCTKGKSPLTCETPGSAIAITGVFWGRNSPDICPSEDGDPDIDCPNAPETEHIVKDMCEGMGSCVLQGKADNLQHGKHCYGVRKYLLVNYTCVPEKNEAILCDSEKSLISCPSDWQLKVNAAFWGRERTDICPSQKGKDVCLGASETVSKLRSKCNNRPFCLIQAFYKDLQNGGENCPRVNKYLVMTYSCRPSPEIGRRGQLGLIPLSVYRSLRIRSRIWNPKDFKKRSKIERVSGKKDQGSEIKQHNKYFKRKSKPRN